MKSALFLLLLVGCGRTTAVERTQPDEITLTPTGSASSTSPPPASSAAPVVTSVVVDLDAGARDASVVAPAARIRCGDAVCGPKQYCLEYANGGGAAPPPGQPAYIHRGAICSSTVPHEGGLVCGHPDKNRHASCTAFIPAAPPQGLE